MNKFGCRLVGGFPVVEHRLHLKDDIVGQIMFDIGKEADPLIGSGDQIELGEIEAVGGGKIMKIQRAGIGWIEARQIAKPVQRPIIKGNIGGDGIAIDVQSPGAKDKATLRRARRTARRTGTTPGVGKVAMSRSVARTALALL